MEPYDATGPVRRMGGSQTEAGRKRRCSKNRDNTMKDLSADRSVAVGSRAVKTAAIFCFVAAGILGCSNEGNKAFIKSHDSLRAGMTLRETFAAGLADYLASVGPKNVPGATLPEKQPASSNCKRHVLDISFSGAFRVRVYCGINSPSAPQLIPEKTFNHKQAFLRALDADYASWAKNMEFRVESPPRALFGIYDHYRFTTDHAGRITTVSPIISSGSGR
jgi:hypothetical protein